MLQVYFYTSVLFFIFCSVSDAISGPVISLSAINKARSGVVLQCESAGWYPEPELLWLDGEGNLLSAGPTETLRGPDDLYTVSSRVTVEKRHSNNITCRVQQRNTNQNDFFPLVCSPAVPIIVCLTVCTILTLASGLFMFKWRQQITSKSQINNLMYMGNYSHVFNRNFQNV
uniref:Ig-like domain-containing protein n=1 Tax=Neolamprologus brichardi TaxID=32507 RepID=A0A3Q4GTH8_NEOBR